MQNGNAWLRLIFFSVEWFYPFAHSCTLRQCQCGDSASKPRSSCGLHCQGMDLTNFLLGITICGYFNKIKLSFRGFLRAFISLFFSWPCAFSYQVVKSKKCCKRTGPQVIIVKETVNSAVLLKLFPKAMPRKMNVQFQVDKQYNH